jgi:hypothetical protein
LDLKDGIVVGVVFVLKIVVGYVGYVSRGGGGVTNAHTI